VNADFTTEEPTQPLVMIAPVDLDSVLEHIDVDICPALTGISRAQLRSAHGRELADNMMREWFQRGRRAA
jgi:hypothetical protein